MIFLSRNTFKRPVFYYIISFGKTRYFSPLHIAIRGNKATKILFLCLGRCIDSTFRRVDRRVDSTFRRVETSCRRSSRATPQQHATVDDDVTQAKDLYKDILCVTLQPCIACNEKQCYKMTNQFKKCKHYLKLTISGHYSKTISGFC